MENFKSKQTWIILSIIVIGIVWKVILLQLDSFPFNSDEAIIGLMARHILDGERPIFFYGQAYMGSLDAYLVALGFHIFGSKVWVIRLIQIILYSGILLTSYIITKRLFKSALAGIISIILLSIPTVNLTLYSTVSLGGYNEALLIGNLIILLSLLLAERFKDVKGSIPGILLHTLLLGFLIGLGLWANGLTLVYSIPSVIFLIRHFTSSQQNRLALVYTLIFISGVLIGASPWLFYALTESPAALVAELSGSAVAVEPVSIINRIFSHAVNFILLGIPVILGIRPPWSVTWLAIPLIPFVLIFWSATVVYCVRQLHHHDEKMDGIFIVYGVFITLLLGFLFSSFGVDPSGRYFTPIQIILTILAGGMMAELKFAMKWKTLVIIGVIIFNAWSTLQCAFKNPPGISTQFDQTTIIDHSYDSQLVDFLKENGEFRGITNYWVSYPLAFISNEELIFVPHLPYHQDLRYTSRDDRYKPYSTLVESSEKIAIITTNTPALDMLIRSTLTKEEIYWKEEVVGDFQIFYALSKPVSGELFGFDQP